MFESEVKLGEDQLTRTVEFPFRVPIVAVIVIFSEALNSLFDVNVETVGIILSTILM